MQIRQFRYDRDNLAYLLVCEGRAVAVDGGAVEEIVRVIREEELELDLITNTHGHADHVCGNEDLARATGARITDQQELSRGGNLVLGGEEIRVLNTPGHTMDSVVFVTSGAMITGDTLFNGTIGNCFSGDLVSFRKSLLTLMSFSDHTLVYAGHDYFLESLDFARGLEPGNGAIAEVRERYNSGHVVTTLQDELQINPYLRTDESSIVELLERRGLDVSTADQRWISMMKAV